MFDNFLNRCEKCKKPFAMKSGDKTLIKTEKTFVLEDMKEPNLRGEMISRQPRFVTAEKRFYEQVSSCKYCGAKSVKTITEDVKNA